MNIVAIANLWSVYLKRHVSVPDVCNLMILLKVARCMEGPHLDAPTDIAGYAAIEGAWITPAPFNLQGATTIAQLGELLKGNAAKQANIHNPVISVIKGVAG